MSDIEKIIVSNTSKNIGGGRFQQTITFEVCTTKKRLNGKGWCDPTYKKISEILLDEWQRVNGTQEERRDVKRWQRRYLQDLEKTYLEGGLQEKNNLPGFN